MIPNPMPIYSSNFLSLFDNLEACVIGFCIGVFVAVVAIGVTDSE